MPSNVDSKFSAECDAYRPILLKVAMRLCRDYDKAHDLVQDTLLRAICASDSFERGSNLQAWLMRILTNSFATLWRQSQRHSRLLEDRLTDTLMGTYGQGHAYADAQEGGDKFSAEVETALAGLSSEYREVVMAADIDGQKYKDIAESLALPIGTVMSRLFRARRMLRKQLSSIAQRDYYLSCAA